MNNAQAFDYPDEIDIDVPLRQRKEELIKLIEAINTLASTESWHILKLAVFDGMIEGLNKRLRQESERPVLNEAEIYRLQGQLNWARKYSDLYKLAEVYKTELNSLTKKLQASTEI